MSRLWIDCTRTISSGLHTGIQRVVRRLLQHAYRYPALRAAPVYWCQNGQCWRVVTCVLPHPQDSWQDAMHWPAQAISPDDTLLLADALWHLDPTVPVQSAVQANLRVIGLCHDVLLATHSHWFPTGLSTPFIAYWRQLSAAAAQIICVSDHTRQAFTALARQLNWQLPAARTIYPGCDQRPSVLLSDLPADLGEWLAALPNGMRIALQVGTVEPRKGYDLVYEAFMSRWPSPNSVAWLVVGQAGWANKSLLNDLQRLHDGPAPMIWLKQATDATLAALYARADVLLGAAHDEGYGLPILEASCAGMAVCLSDTAIHREVMSRLPESSVRWVRTGADPSHAWQQALANLPTRQATKPPQYAHLDWSVASQAFIMAAFST